MLSIANESALTPLDTIHSTADPLGLIPLPIDNRQRFLRFTLAQQHDTLLPLAHILEVMQLALSDIFPVPDVPQCILGLCSWQGETLWLVDLNHLVGFSPLFQQSQLASKPIVIVIEHEQQTLGLVVEQVGDVDRLDEANLYLEPGLCPPGLEPFVMGYCRQSGGTVLNSQAILSAPLWQSSATASLSFPAS